MTILRRLFRREPDSYVRISERSAFLPSAEIRGPVFPRPVTSAEAREALARSRARREAK